MTCKQKRQTYIRLCATKWPLLSGNSIIPNTIREPNSVIPSSTISSRPYRTGNWVSQRCLSSSVQIVPIVLVNRVSPQKIIGWWFFWPFLNVHCNILTSFRSPLHHLLWPFCWFYFTPCWLTLLSKFLGSIVSSSEDLPRVLNPISQASILIPIHCHLPHLNPALLDLSHFGFRSKCTLPALAALYCIGPSASLGYSPSPPLVGPALPLLGYDRTWHNYGLVVMRISGDGSLQGHFVLQGIGFSIITKDKALSFNKERCTNSTGQRGQRYVES